MTSSETRLSPDIAGVSSSRGWLDGVFLSGYSGSSLSIPFGGNEVDISAVDSQHFALLRFNKLLVNLSIIREMNGYWYFFVNICVNTLLCSITAFAVQIMMLWGYPGVVTIYMYLFFVYYDAKVQRLKIEQYARVKRPIVWPPQLSGQWGWGRKYISWI